MSMAPFCVSEPELEAEVKCAKSTLQTRYANARACVLLDVRVRKRNSMCASRERDGDEGEGGRAKIFAIVQVQGLGNTRGKEAEGEKGRVNAPAIFAATAKFTRAIVSALMFPSFSFASPVRDFPCSHLTASTHPTSISLLPTLFAPFSALAPLAVS